MICELLAKENVEAVSNQTHQYNTIMTGTMQG